MSEQRGMIIAIVLSTLILFVFHFFSEQNTIEEMKKNEPEIAGYVNNVASPAQEPTLTREDALNLSERVQIKTRKLSGSINTTGAMIDDISLENYKENMAADSANVKLLNPAGTNEASYISLCWRSAAKSEGELNDNTLPDEKTKWNVVETPPENQLIKLAYTTAKGVAFERTISLDDNYMISVTDRVINNSEQELKICQCGEIARAAAFSTNKRIASSVFEGGIGNFDKNMREISFEKLEGKDSATQCIKDVISNGWVGFTDKYWLTSLIIKDTNPVKVNIEKDANLMKCTTTTGEILIKPGETVEYKNLIFVGAKELGVLEGYGKTHGIDKFDLSIDFGWLYLLTKPLFYLLQALFSFLGNMALAIILLTLLSKVALFPFARKSNLSMAKMKSLQPKLERLKLLYGDNKIRMNEEMLKLYRSEKVNPASGCLPLLIQMPIFFCLYKVFSISIGLRHAPLFLWIKDLAAPDPSSLFNLFGLLPWAPPQFLQIGILHILMGATMFWQQRISPQPTDNSQAKMMMYFMPLSFVFMFTIFPVPSGLLLYWTTSNILAIVQQLFMTPRNAA
ncbi:MAG: membrane protein insertase YidC [Holosporales bacterium]|jgi:YidC/Oxa1 family membrane protein insertase|nr:membrane protein insertase YidC [Holosporales bacterium]